MSLHLHFVNVRLLVVLGACTLLGMPTAGHAAWACGIAESLLPGIYALDVVDGNLKAFTGPLVLSKDSRHSVGNALTLGEGGDWTFQSDVELPVRRDSNSADSCMDPPTDEDWLKRNKPWAVGNIYFEQHIGVCATGDGKRWGGISFYGGEDSGGAGGIVEQDIATGNFRYYRPGMLIDLSTSHLEYFGDHLWIGTAWYGECGTGIGVGVLSGYFGNDELYADWSLGAHTCGFQVSDMLVHGDSLWIATELGLSQVSRSADRYRKFDWKSFVPTGDPANPMREVTCDELYEELFRSEELATALPNDDGHPYDVLWRRISKLRPDFAWQYVRKLNGLEPPLEGEDPE